MKSELEQIEKAVNYENENKRLFCDLEEIPMDFRNYKGKISVEIGKEVLNELLTIAYKLMIIHGKMHTERMPWCSYFDDVYDAIEKLKGGITFMHYCIETEWMGDDYYSQQK